MKVALPDESETSILSWSLARSLAPSSSRHSNHVYQLN